MTHATPAMSRRAFVLGAATVAIAGTGLAARAEDHLADGAFGLPPSTGPLATFTHLTPGLFARYAPTGNQIVFDRKGSDGIRSVWTARADAAAAATLSSGDSGFAPHRHAGIANWHPSGD